jgi:CheY-like chemotaxis protein
MRKLGNEVCVAYDGLEAIAAAERFLPDVVLLDLGMPKLDGFGAARHIRQQAWGQDMLLVALTGWGQDADKQRTKSAGFDHHLVKPAGPDVLLHLLANAPRRTRCIESTDSRLPRVES